MVLSIRGKILQFHISISSTHSRIVHACDGLSFVVQSHTLYIRHARTVSQLTLLTPDFSHNSVLTSRLRRNRRVIIFYLFWSGRGEACGIVVYLSDFHLRVPSSSPAGNINDECIPTIRGCTATILHTCIPTIRGCTATILHQSAEPMPASLRHLPPGRVRQRKREREKEGGVKLKHPACKKRPFCTFFGIFSVFLFCFDICYILLSLFYFILYFVYIYIFFLDIILKVKGQLPLLKKLIVV